MKHEFFTLTDEIILESSGWFLQIDESKKIRKVTVDDEIIVNNPYIVHLYSKDKEPQPTNGFKTFLVYFKNEGEGLDYHGITIIPTSSLPKFILNITQVKGMFNNKAYVKALAKRGKNKEDCIQELNNLIELCKSAIEQNKYVIHFGI